MIAALLPSDVRLQRLRAALPATRALAVCDGWSDLARECQRGAALLVVFDLYADGAPDFERIRQLRTCAPRAALVAYIDPSRARPRDMFDAGRCGLEALVILDENDAPEALVGLIARATARGAATLVRPRVAGLRRAVRDAVLLAVTRAHERLTPERLARLIAVSRRALTRRLSEAELPPPHQLLTWGRLVVAAHLLEDAGRSADGVALALDFPSGSAFRNVCKRYVGATPLEIRARGGAEYVIGELFSRRAAAGLDDEEADGATTADAGDEGADARWRDGSDGSDGNDGADEMESALESDDGTELPSWDPPATTRSRSSADRTDRAARGRQRRRCVSSRNSSRVRASSWNTPRSALVTVREFCFSTPRIIMQRCTASRRRRRRGAAARPAGRPRSARRAAPAPAADARRPRPRVAASRLRDPAVRDVGDVRAAEERQQVMLAERVELDVAHEHHRVAARVGDRLAEHVGGAQVHAPRQEAHRLDDALRRSHEPLARGVLAEQRQHPSDVGLERGIVGCAGRVVPRVVPRVMRWRSGRCGHRRVRGASACETTGRMAREDR